jgi:hypothetical protein
MGYVAKATLYPIPVAPLDYSMYAALGTFALGIIVLLVNPGMRRRIKEATVFDLAKMREGTAGTEGKG